jgi:hypothetical protein
MKYNEDFAGETLHFKNKNRPANLAGGMVFRKVLQSSA